MKTDWFTHDRFGMFIHWGLYAIPARGEWVRSIERISVEDYQKYFDSFNPQNYNPKEWAKLAKEAGMKYAVLTAKHHDGFCLFDSAYTDYKSTNTQCGRDLVREFLDAFRDEGLKVGLYYSLLDWHHPDYPHYGDKIHPMRDNEAFKDVTHDFPNYLKYLHSQVEELCTSYGKLDILWFDFSYDNLHGEAWEATKLVRMVRGLQPGILIDNRLEVSGEGYGSIAKKVPLEYAGDFASPEQIIPHEGLVGEDGLPINWEACITMNNSWGFAQKDTNFKPAPMLIKKLVECVSKGGNLLLNVGPDANGRIPEESIKILKDIGAWISRNGKSIYGCGRSGLPKPDSGRITRNGEKLYYHIYESQVGPIQLEGLKKDDIKSMRLISTGSELDLSDSWVLWSYPGIPFVSFGDSPLLPDPVDTVVEVELKQ
ncbi:MAG: alpha-L-fucosidase [Clostridiales bacterium]|nr:alpha-L-fucosidase [Clostridiales bacterium]